MPIRLTPAVKALVIACFAAFVVQQTADRWMGTNILSWLALVPSGFVLHFRFWQLVTYAFLHADPMHLFLNMMMLVFIGGELEATWGTARFLRFYFVCVASGGLTYLALQLLINGSEGLYTPMVGASGGIYGLLIAYGLIFGERVLLFMMLFPMKAKHFIWVLALIELMTSVFSSGSSIAGAAHLGGMAAGFAFLWGRAALIVAKRRRAEAPPKRKKRSGKHLKLVIDNDDDDRDDEPKTWH
jgi:membrane associated rhomboid family serine protease